MFDKFAKLALCLSILLATASSRAGNCVTINSDNVVLINGQKIFPIGFTLGPPVDGKTPAGKDAFQELADAGATLIRTGTTEADWTDQTLIDEQRREDAAAKAGIYCWVHLRELDSIGRNETNKEAMLRRVINRFKDQPACAFWKGVDEPEWDKAKVPRMLRAKNLIRELDTNHPIIIMQAPRGSVKTLRPYNAAGDIIGADVYPVSYPPGKHSLLPNKEISMVGDYTRTMMTVSEGRMPVWMVLQICWSGVAGEGKTLRFPTFAEERFMTYQAIINGARGLVYFGGNVKAGMSPEDAELGWKWHFWNRILRPVIEEIGTHSRLAPALVAPESKLPVKVNNGQGIEYCVREVGADLYILACKREGSTVKAEFDHLPFAIGTGEVLYEAPRKVEAKNGKFTDWFGPFEVHVYHFTNALSDKIRN
jgi:hypothetical protein